MNYKHTQIGKVGIGIIIFAAIITIVSITTEDFSKYSPEWMDASDWDIYGIVIVCVIYLIVLNMTILTIQTDKQSLRWQFGIGFPKKSINLSDIESVIQVRNKWIMGFGIRKLLSGGWLYNVHGLDAVEITTRHGKIVRLGTDEPKKLARTLSSIIDSKANNND